MRVERSGQVVRVRSAVNHHVVGGAGERAKPKDKPFAISKWVVWDAFQRVKANDGAAGVDGESIKEFERDLKGNLYKLWNSSGIGCHQEVTFRRRSGQSKYRRSMGKARSGSSATWRR
jgi:hypothetical protein